MRLPEMPTINPVTKPPIEEITYDSWFLKTLVVRSDLTQSNATIIVHRYNYENEILSPDSQDEYIVNTSNIYELATKYTLWQNIIGMLVAGASLVVKEDEYINKIANINQQILDSPEGNIEDLELEKAELEVQLGIIRQQMGLIS